MTQKNDIAAMLAEPTVRTFAGGATRNDDPSRIDFCKMHSLPVEFAYAEFMARNRHTPAGLRDMDNWKSGFPFSETIESLTRHTKDLEALTFGITPMRDCDIPDTCCAILFNATAYLHKYLEELQA